MGAAFKREVGAPQTERSPASGVRPAVREPVRQPSQPEVALAFEAAPFSAIPPANSQEEGLALEDAVPFSGNSAIAAVFLFATSAAAALVAIGLYL